MCARRAGQNGLALGPGNSGLGKGTWPVMASVKTKTRARAPPRDRTGFPHMDLLDGKYKVV
jgi:hypothetical protein